MLTKHLQCIWEKQTLNFEHRRELSSLTGCYEMLHFDVFSPLLLHICVFHFYLNWFEEQKVHVMLNTLPSIIITIRYKIKSPTDAARKSHYVGTSSFLSDVMTRESVVIRPKTASTKAHSHLIPDFNHIYKYSTPAGTLIGSGSEIFGRYSCLL